LSATAARAGSGTAPKPCSIASMAKIAVSSAGAG
jgi:hypothetical protein